MVLDSKRQYAERYDEGWNVRHAGARRRMMRCVAIAALAAFASGCATVAEHRKLERQVQDLQRGAGAAPREAVADLSREIELLRGDLRELRGRIDVAEKTAADALAQARRARQDLAQNSAAPLDEPVAETQEEEPESEEVKAYRAAYTAWRQGETRQCIDRFREFLQAFGSSPYADDAAFWMADCHFKQGDYKNAVLRFDDVVRTYPQGNKAPDALYRQGESLLKLGPGYQEAARRAFERVVTEYPDSARAAEARRQLELVGATG